MSHQTHSARIIDPIRVVANNGRARTIPAGPCLIEELEGDLVDIVWGAAGEKSVAMPSTQVESAEREGKLVLLD
jgi:hypothetical protein